MATLSINDVLFTRTRQKLLGLLYGHPDRTFYTNELVRLADVGVGSVQRELDRMLQAGLIKVERIGNQRHYQADPDCVVYQELTGLVNKMSMPDANQGGTKMDTIVEQYRQQILQLARKNGVRNVRVFGSMARNEANENSDLDLLVDLEHGRSGFALGGFLEDVSNLVHRKVDVVTEKSLHAKIRDKVIKEARAL